MLALVEQHLHWSGNRTINPTSAKELGCTIADEPDGGNMSI
jgi:hypothetical protein